MREANSVVWHRSEEPILPVDRPWEARASLRAISVMPDADEGRLRLYYLVWCRPDWSRNALCVAFSDDGLNWEKPDLGDGHNVVMRGSGCKLDWGVFFPHQIIHDPVDEDEKRRWKMVYWDRPVESSPYGICLARSRDGYAWEPQSDHPVITGVNDGSCLIATHRQGPCPSLKSNYHIYQQTWKFNPALPMGRDNLKGIQGIGIAEIDPEVLDIP
jgi:hypothetical protein